MTHHTHTDKMKSMLKAKGYPRWPNSKGRIMGIKSSKSTMIPATSMVYSTRPLPSDKGGRVCCSNIRGRE